MKTLTRRPWLIALAALVLGVGLSGADEPKPKADPPGESPYAAAARAAAARRSTQVFTNEDLKRLSQADRDDTKLSLPSAPAPEAEPSTPAEPKDQPDPLKQLMQREEERKLKQAEIAAAEQRLVDAKQRLADLEKRRLAVVNPFLARPDVGDKGRDEWNKLTPAERRAQTDRNIEKARAEIDKAAGELDRLRREAF